MKRKMYLLFVLFCKVFLLVMNYIWIVLVQFQMLHIVAYYERMACYIMFAYFCNNCSPFVNFFNNYMMLLGNVLIIDLFESYIVQCKFDVNVCILIKIH
jgi:hypothetical protein